MRDSARQRLAEAHLVDTWARPELDHVWRRQSAERTATWRRQDRRKLRLIGAAERAAGPAHRPGQHHSAAAEPIDVAIWQRDRRDEDADELRSRVANGRESVGVHEPARFKHVDRSTVAERGLFSDGQ